MAGIGFESKQTEDTAVTQVEYGPFSVRYAYSRSYERVTGNRPSNDYLEWKANENTLVFAICDGVETSHAGGSAARFLGHKLVEFLANLSIEEAEDLALVRSKLDTALVDWMPAAQRALRSRVKSSETVFTCGRVSVQPDGLRGFMAGSGLVYVRLYDRKERDVAFTPLRHAYDHWSSVRGLRGQLFVQALGPRPPLQRMMLYTDGLSELEDALAGYSRAELQSAILESFHSVLNDDISLLDVQACDRPAGGKPVKTVYGAEEQAPVYLERVDDGLEWEMRPGTVYSILESRNGQDVQVVSAGNFYNWRPALEVACEYRVCLVSSAGRAYSPWLIWDPTSTDPEQREDPLDVEGAPDDRTQVWEDDLPEIMQQPVVSFEEALADAIADNEDTIAGPPFDEGVVPVEEFEPAPEPENLAETPVERQSTETPEQAPDGLETAAPVPEEFLEDLAEDAGPRAVQYADPPQAGLDDIAMETTQAAEPEPALADSVPLPGEEISPMESAEEIFPAQELDVPAARPLSWLSRLPSVGAMLQQARGFFQEKLSTPRFSRADGGSEPRVEKGKYPGQYVFLWQAVAGANEYEIWDQAQDGPGKDAFQRTSDTRLRLERLSPGSHRVHVRPLGAGFDADWQAWPWLALTVPAPVETAPGSVRVETTNEDAMLHLRWSAIADALVEEYWVFEVGREEHRLIGKVAGDIRTFPIRKTGPERIRRFTIRGVNWGGLGPESEPAVYQPGAASAGQNRITARRERPSQPLTSEVRLTQIAELCDAVNRWTKSQGMQMSAIKLEQRYENVDQYLLLESRKLNQLVTLPILKGPEYRLTVYGVRGEVLVVEIRFEKRNWNFLVKYLPVIRRG